MKGFLAFPVLLFLLFGTPAIAHFATGLEAYNSGDYTTALKEWKPLAEQGMVDAQFNLGWMYNFGKGVKRSYSIAAKWYHLAADQGHADAQYNLALMYEKGLGVTRDYKAAVVLYKKAVEQGYTKAHYNLGKMYADGKGVARDYKAANKWFRLAAEQGNASAQSKILDDSVSLLVHLTQIRRGIGIPQFGS